MPFIDLLVLDAVVLGIVFIGLALFGIRFKDLGFRLSLKEFGLGIWLFIKLVVISVVLGAILFFFGVRDIEIVRELVMQLALPSIIYLFVVRTFIEELFFRAFLITWLERFFGRGKKLLHAFTSSLVFGIAHFGYGSKAELVGAVVLGFILALEYVNGKNVLRNYIGHFLYNLAFFIS